MTLFVEESGTLDAPSIVFLHGVGTSGWMWWRQTAACPDYHCLNIDLPGHGKSNAVKWVSLADTAEQVARVIRERSSNGRAHVVGLSLGGYVALVLLERYPSVLDRVIISGVTASPMPNRNLMRPQLWFLSAMRKSRWILNMQARALHLPPDKQTAFTENFQAMSMETYHRIMVEAVDFTASPGLSRVNVPTLIVAGSRESKIILDSVPAISKLMPNAKGRLATGVEHGWNVQAPDLFNAMVRAWIREMELPRGLEEIR